MSIHIINAGSGFNFRDPKDIHLRKRRRRRRRRGIGGGDKEEEEAEEEEEEEKEALHVPTDKNVGTLVIIFRKSDQDLHLLSLDRSVALSDQSL